MDSECAKCGKAVSAPLCPDCVRLEAEDAASAFSERLDGFDRRLTEIEGEIVRLQQKLLYMR